MALTVPPMKPATDLLGLTATTPRFPLPSHMPKRKAKTSFEDQEEEEQQRLAGIGEGGEPLDVGDRRPG